MYTGCPKKNALSECCWSHSAQCTVHYWVWYCSMNTFFWDTLCIMVRFGTICEPAMCVSPSSPVLVADATHERWHQGEEPSAPYKIILSVKFKSHNDGLRKQSLDKHFKKHFSKLAHPSPLLLQSTCCSQCCCCKKSCSRKKRRQRIFFCFYY